MRRILASLLICLPVYAFAVTPQTAILDVQNMTCSMCSITIHKALEKVPGVIEAKVDFDHKTATVKYDAKKTTPNCVGESHYERRFSIDPAYRGTELMTLATTVLLESTLTCPRCGHATLEEMPLDSCRFFHECVRCHTLMRPQMGDCCVFCSHGSVKCPPVQLQGCCCNS